MSHDDIPPEDLTTPEETPSVKPTWLAKYFTGELLNPNASPPPPPMSAGEFLSRYRAVRDAITSAESHLEAQRANLAALEELAHRRRDLRAALRDEVLRTTPAPSVDRAPEPVVRCRVVRQFSTEHARLLYTGNVGDVHDLPAGLVERLHDRLERVGPEVALYTVPPNLEPRR